jgi:protein tyrosine phosphatase type 4A
MTTDKGSGTALASKVAPLGGSISSSSNNGGGGATSSSVGVVSISSKPTPLTYGKLHFLIMDAPKQSNLHLYIRECRRFRVTDIVRVCEPTYHGAELSTAGIVLHEMAYDDGRIPPPIVLDSWLQLVEERFYTTNTTLPIKGAAGAVGDGGTTDGTTPPVPGTIAVNCVAGLGRAPVLVAIALMEFENMDAVDAVTLIRRHRRGAINENQLMYLEGYKKRGRHRGKKNGGKGGGGGETSSCGCSIM